MLTRRSFLRKAGLAAGAALVALGLRKAPKAKAEAITLGGPLIAPPETFPYLGELAKRRDDAFSITGVEIIDADQGEVAVTINRVPELTEQELEQAEKWRVELEDLNAKTVAWLENMNAEAGDA